MRTDITFHSGDDWCAGWLYRPEGFEGARPLMVMAHGFSGTKELRLPAYAERFCAAGIGVLLFDYRHFGASGGKPRQLVDISRQHADFRRALAYARDLDWVDPERVGLFGSSFSGGHVLAVGAADGRVAAIVSQCPFTDGLATLPALGLKTIMRATVAGLRDQVTALRRGAPYYIPAAAPPGSLGVMTTDDSLSGMTTIAEQSVDPQWGAQPRRRPDHAAGGDVPTGPELNTTIAHLREVLGDQTYESLARKGETMTTAAMVAYAYDQIEQARTELNGASK